MSNIFNTLNTFNMFNSRLEQPPVIHVQISIAISAYAQFVSTCNVLFIFVFAMILTWVEVVRRMCLKRVSFRQTPIIACSQLLQGS